ncbi:MAG TPA: glycosyltransferase family 4 protein [Burkholderiaceae bacterium]|nr:glycosyltransferase family 4 protein [Burkholderiaceae bacterium]
MTSTNHPQATVRQPYKFGFVLNTAIGNLTRYLNLRKYAQREPDVELTWAPVSHYTAPDVPSRLRFLPAPLFMRARVLQQAWPLLRRLDDFDAVMIHLFEADVLCALRGCLRGRPLRFSSTDEAPIVDRANYPLYPNELAKSRLRQRARLALDLWRVRHTDYFLPFSHWGANILVRDCGAPAERVRALHVGMDLELWRWAPKPARPAGRRLRLLFVGGDFVRKGGPLLLQVFQAHFQDSAELHLVTKQAPKLLPANVHVHADFEPNDERLRQLYAEMDLMVVPTTADVGPLWVFLEAMAMGLPIIGTEVGASTEIVRNGETGFTIKVGDGEALRQAIQHVCDRPELGHEMGLRGRALIESEYNAAVNVPSIVRTMKDAVDRQRAGRAS